MLRGESILRPNRKEDGKPDGSTLLPLPSDEKMAKLFDDTVRDAFAGMPSARNAQYQAARAVYAALSADSGDRDTSVLNMNRWKKAIELATGGIEDHNGRSIVLPYGQDYGQFKDGLRRRLEDLVESGRLDERWGKFGALDTDVKFHSGTAMNRLASLPLEPVGDGRYALKVGDAYLADKEGKRVVLDFRNPAPFRTSGYRLFDYSGEPTVAELEEAMRPGYDVFKKVTKAQAMKSPQQKK